MNKIKMIKALLSISITSMVAIGCSNLDIFNSSKILDISKVKDDENAFYYRSMDITNSKEIEKYNTLKVTSYNGVFDNKTLEYKISVKYKNTSKEDMKDLTLRVTAIGLDSAIELDTISKDSVKSGEEFQNTWVISNDDLLEMYSSSLENETETSINEEFIYELLQNEMSNIKTEYTYENDLDSNLCITQHLDFNGNEQLSSMNIYKDFDDINDLKINHVNNGSYLNLVEPEDITAYNYIKVENIEVKIDDNLNFDIIAKFKNNSKTDISNFKFTPMLIFNQTASFDSQEMVKSGKNDLIKPGEEFEFEIKINKNDFIENLSKMSSEDLGIDFKGTGDELLNYLIKNRMVSILYSYDYENEDLKYSTNANYCNSSKLQRVYTTILDKE